MAPPINFPEPENIEAAHRAILEEFLAHLRQVCDLQTEWPLKVKVSIGAALDFAAAAPERAKVLTRDLPPVPTESPPVGVQARDHLAAMLAGGRGHIAPGPLPPGLTEQILVGGMQAVIGVRLMNGEALQLPDLAPQLVQIFLSPYLGQGEAARVAGRPRPAPPEP